MELIHDIIDDPDEYLPALLFVGGLLATWLFLMLCGIISVQTSRRRLKFWLALPSVLFGLIGVKSQIPISWTSGTFQGRIECRWFFLLPLALGITGFVQWFRAKRKARLSLWH